MPILNSIIRADYGNPVPKIPIIIAMIDSDGAVKEIPLKVMPFTDFEQAALAESGVNINTEVIYGIELMINPTSMSTNISKLVGRSQTMTNFVEDHWGEEIDTITLQGLTASFVTGGNDIYSIRLNNNNSPTQAYLQQTAGSVQSRSLNGYGSGIHDDEIGLTTSQRRKSVSYRHFKRLLDLFRVNGCFFDTFGLVSKRYSIMISYGREAYRGYFESIDVTETAENPFRFQYTLTFKSQETIYSYIKQPTIKPGSQQSTTTNFTSTSSTPSN